MFVAVASLAVAFALLFRNDPSPKTTRSSLAAAQSAIRVRDWKKAATLAAAALEDRPGDTSLLLIAGEAAARLQRFDEAIKHYDVITDTAGDDAAIARLCSGDVRLKLGRLSEAERDFREALGHDPRQQLARSRLAAVLMISAR